MAEFGKFDFKKYPQLKKGYKKYAELDGRASRLSRKDSADYAKASEALNEYAYGEFALAIYEVFNPVKPLLHNRRKGGYFPWEEIFTQPFADLTLSQKKYLVGLLEGNFVYVLPEEFYSK